MPALARLAVYQVRSSATSPLTIARAGPARRMPKTSSRRRKLIARIATPSSPSPLSAAPDDQPKYLLWHSYGEIPLEEGLKSGFVQDVRSDERREGKECVSTCNYRCAP